VKVGITVASRTYTLKALILLSRRSNDYASRSRFSRQGG
jgi:hypothetical protein